MRDALLSAHPWSFATKKAALAPLATAPVSDFAYAHQLPTTSSRRSRPAMRSGVSGLVFQIVNRELHSNAETVVLNYIFQASEGDFPAYFTPALVTRSPPSSACR